jgi:glycosyltransferase involved in cell wall biosynthesis
VQTRHDQGGDCIINTRFRNGDMCDLLQSVDCASCITSRPNIFQRTLSAFAVNTHRGDVAQAYRRHKTIFVSEMLKRNFARVAGPGKWGTVVHNFVDAKNFRSVLGSAEISYRASKEKRVVFAAGKLYPAKGFDTLLKTLIPEMPDDMQLLIAGDGPDEERLRRIYESKNVKFLGWLSPTQILQSTLAADFVVVPSLWEEPCSTTIFEGLVLGKPTFALERGGTPELEIYSRYPHQLRLSPDMASLVSDLVGFRSRVSVPLEFDDRCGVERALPRLLEIYRAPPGYLSD